MSYHIEGRRWFQRLYGNTYNTVNVFKDGKHLVHLPVEYGYGDYYLQRAEDWLAHNGFPELLEVRPNGSRVHGGPQWMYDHGISTSVVDVAREKDL